MQHIVGRFAPSPSGLLHFGSFVTALGSYLQAKSQDGKWIVRIEDLDPPRMMAGADKHILGTLESLGFYWDGDVVYQSARLHYYRDIISQLQQQQLTYFCDCSRQRTHILNDGIYDNHCRSLKLSSSCSSGMALRLKQTKFIDSFIDNIRGYQKISKQEQQEDFIIRRRDGLFAYNLAVVVDDHLQGITEVVRGADLLPVTGRQISLYQLFKWPLPSYFHLPLALNNDSTKLSKQNHAQPLILGNVKQLMIDGLTFLGQKIPQEWQDLTQEQLLKFAIKHWSINKVPTENKSIEFNRQ